MNAWIKELLNNLDVQFEENKRIEIMEACGEKCPFTHLTDERLLETLRKTQKMKWILLNNYLSNGV